MGFALRCVVGWRNGSQRAGRSSLIIVDYLVRCEWNRGLL